MPIFSLFFKYYFDVNKVNFIVTFIILILFRNVVAFSITFSTFGLFISYLSFNYFHSIEYYFYANGGYSKTKLSLRTWLINILFSSTCYFIFK
jgi:hypothetical protein